MRKIVFLFALFVGLSTASYAQGVYCTACDPVDVSFAVCASWMGPIPNCSTYCDGWVCGCKGNAYGGRCTRDADGGYSWKTYYRIRFVQPAPFEQQFKIVSVDVRQRPATTVRRGV